MKLGPCVATPRTSIADVRGDQVTVYAQDPDGDWHAPAEASSARIKDKTVRFLRDLVIPRNYPDSVSADYLPTRKWEFVHSFAGVVAGFYAGAAVAVAMGANPMWTGVGMVVFNLIRDQVCQLAGFGFSKVAPLAEKKARPWMLTGEVLEKIGTISDTAAGLLGPALLPVLCSASALVRAFSGTVKGTSMAAIGPRQATNGNLGEVGAKNGCQAIVSGMLANGLAMGTEHMVASTLGHVVGPALVATTFSLVAIWAQGQYVKHLDYHPVNEEAVRDVVREGEDQGPSQKLWRTLPSIFVKDKVHLGRSLKPLMQDSQRFAELEGLYADRNHLMEWKDGKPYIVLRETRLQDGARTNAEDRFLAVVQACHAEQLAQSDEYRIRTSKDGHTAADHWVVAESQRRTPTDAHELLASMEKAGWSADALRFNDQGWRGRWTCS